jgi:hypothetical protein
MYKIYDIWPEIAKESHYLDLDRVNFKNISMLFYLDGGFWCTT